MDKKQEVLNNDRRQFWQMAFGTHKVSGLTIKQFCKNEGISQAAYYYWRKKLAVAGEAVPAKQKDAASAGFIQVSMPEMNPAGLELVLSSGNALRISPGVDYKTLSQVLSVLSEAGLC